MIFDGFPIDANGRVVLINAPFQDLHRLFIIEIGTLLLDIFNGPGDGDAAFSLQQFQQSLDPLPRGFVVGRDDRLFLLGLFFNILICV